MAKPIPKVGSRRNGRNSAQKSARRIPKGVIHVQESFNNTIVTIADVRGRVISWSSVGTCGFKGTRRGTPYSSNSRPRSLECLNLTFQISYGFQFVEGSKHPELVPLAEEDETKCLELENLLPLRFFRRKLRGGRKVTREAWERKAKTPLNFNS
ncbi:30S ribosomal protein S11, chloroplastic [Gossypium hirsutum]|uniref:30S ribosomal protein S11, chloroplastic n=1 Tax=Gossypium hirsutum TaxID=3635 RepID=A0A1U8JPU9_GOSHI|nr:30S ribosomal protein S11, chloroplastic-like [Gossypium hirsutum]